MSLSAERRM
ncbi:hypothetical protein BN1723_021042 [Verticillium longisporum]|uniref:Uncharacterized protein n=1 Tax=Verticillium longisporum TaxID=100787 RepID=A0A0G4L5W8_VERLO|nr:hypothetical protein BN1723_021042 [Verticillium longisporum]